MSRENPVIFLGIRSLSQLVFLSLAVIVMLTTALSARAETRNVVVVGDSLVAGYGLAPGEAFPEQLQLLANEAGLDVAIENAGVSGDTTSGGLARLDWSVPDETDVVILELGANDALRGLPPAVTRSNLEAMIERLKDRDIAVILAGMQAPPNMGEAYEQAFNRIYPELAKAHDIALYPFFLDGVAAEKSLNQADGIHPTAEGIRIIAERFLPFFKSSLAEPDGS